MSLVPVIDLQSPTAPSDIDRAASTIGFFQITGHGVADEVVEGMLDATERFVRSPLAVKEAVAPPSMSINRGWSPVGKESLAYSLGVEAPPDLFEAFNIGHEVGPEEDDGAFFAANLWPDVPGFRDAYLRYFDEVEALAKRITPLMAVGLGLPADFFVDKTSHSPDVLRVNWYERADGSAPLLPGQQRMGAHTDYGVLTVLWADRVPGLEIVDPSGSWVGVQPEPGCFLVNLGDLLAQWTNDRWRSTLHRVVPPVGEGPCLRRSAAFFHEADADALVECIPGVGEAKYAPVTAGEHLVKKLQGSRELQRSTATSTVGERPVA